MTHSLINEGYIIKKNDDSEEIIPIPYNTNNILIEKQDIISILNKLEVGVDDINKVNLFQKAFTHKSYLKKDIIPEKILKKAKAELGNPKNLLELRDESYERLEYLGDRVIKLIVTKYLFLRYPHEDEGFMTKLQTKIEDKRNLAAMSKELGFDKYFIISRQIESKYGRNLEKIHEDIFEAFMGALYLSNGYEPCLLLLVNLLETMIDYSEKLYCDNNYKDIILRHYHKQQWKYPKYEVIYHEGPPHDRIYLMGVLKDDINSENCMEEKYIGFGVGNSKKIGEQKAAKMALIIFGLLNDDQYNQSDIYYPDWNIIKMKLENCDDEESDRILNSKSGIFIQKDKHLESDSDSDKNEESSCDDLDGDELDV